ncbi:unnamed protein product [Nippostrongylus brasiliensis]|uniref:Uncharacterized protein n=1 Tax=Nippostrongylus brasiliensis TaxID=27835 RepID=A0A0N4YC16_NIPBR|nr:unnamed protein product [Nippostrongylus brasiliensis]
MSNAQEWLLVFLYQEQRAYLFSEQNEKRMKKKDFEENWTGGLPLVEKHDDVKLVAQKQQKNAIVTHELT